MTEAKGERLPHRPCRVAILINSLDGGGAERVASRLLREMHGRVPGLELVQVHPGRAYDVPDGLPVFHLSPLRLPGGGLLALLPLLALRLCALAKRRGYSLVQSHLFLANYVNVMAGIMGSSHRRQLVNCVSVGSKFGGPSPVDALHRRLIRELYGRADTMICKSRGMLDDLARFADLPQDTRVIYNPFSGAEIAAQSAAPVPADAFWRRWPFLVACTARFHPNKRQIDLVEALGRLAGQGRDLGLVLLGEGACRDEVAARAGTLGLSERVLFAGRVANPFAYMSRCHAFVLPSESEGFPNALVEAMICGLPVLAADCLSGPREIIAPGTGAEHRADSLERHPAGYLFPVRRADLLAEGIATLMDTPGLCASMSSAARRRAADFDERPVIEEYFRLLRFSSETVTA